MVKLQFLVLCMTATTVTSTATKSPDAAVIDEYLETLAMAGFASTAPSHDERLLRGFGAKEQGKCPPGLSTDLIEFPQWQDEVG